MSRDKLFISHIFESINLIERYVKDINYDNFVNSIDIQDKVLRRLEIIGEAVKNLSAEIKQNNSDIEWKKIAGLRDIIIHNYFGVDLELTWNVIINDLPNLKSRIKIIEDNLMD